MTQVRGQILLDPQDQHLLAKHSWNWIGSGIGKRLAAKTKNRHMMLHHFILPKKKGFDVDHINRNIFDNRRENLRYVTHSQNMMNMKKSAINTSGFRGVTWNKRRKKWVAQIGFQMEKIYLGAFNDIEAAARAYKTAALKYFEEYLGET